MFLPSDHDIEEKLRAFNPALWVLKAVFALTKLEG
ncbi:MAG: hypothetical protein RL091_3367, partial [Verrucomicrobiota bacterium]